MRPRPPVLALLLLVMAALPAARLAAKTLGLYLETTDGRAQTVEALSATERGITIQIEKGSMMIPMDRVVSWRVKPPKEWLDAEKALKEDKPARAVPAMRNLAATLLPWLSIPKGDAENYVFAYVNLLRSRKDYQGALAFLEKIPESVPATTTAQAIILAAYCHSMLGDVDKAETMLNKLRSPTRRSALFTLYKLARARIAWERKDLVTALDEIASVVAYKRLGSESYDEALYLSAEAYDALGAAIAKQKEKIAADDKLRRLYEQNRGEAFDQLGIMRSDHSSVSAIMDDPPDLPGVSIEIRKQIVRVFPNSPWATLARAKLPPGALDKMATQVGEAKGVEKTSTENPEQPPAPTPAPTPDDGKIDAEKAGRDSENI